jgi:hypothetical protein
MPDSVKSMTLKPPRSYSAPELRRELPAEDETREILFSDDRFLDSSSILPLIRVLSPEIDIIQELHAAFTLRPVQGNSGIPVYQIFDEEKAVQVIRQLIPRIKSREIDINAPIQDPTFDSRYSGYPPLAAALREASVPVVKELLKLDEINLDARDNRSQDSIPFRTILMHAVRGATLSSLPGEESLQALKLLLADDRITPLLNIALKNRIDEKEYTALDIAISTHKKYPNELSDKVVSLLLERGAKAKAFLAPNQAN